MVLFVLLGRSVTLEGSQEGIRQYLSSDWSVLVDQPDVWMKAVSQIFFSLGASPVCAEVPEPCPQCARLRCSFRLCQASPSAS